MAPVNSRMRSASVDFPWSMWAMMQKLRMWSSFIEMRPRSRQAERDVFSLLHEHLGQGLRSSLRIDAQNGFGSRQAEKKPAVILEDELHPILAFHFFHSLAV